MYKIEVLESFSFFGHKLIFYLSQCLRLQGLASSPLSDSHNAEAKHRSSALHQFWSLCLLRLLVPLLFFLQKSLSSGNHWERQLRMTAQLCSCDNVSLNPFVGDNLALVVILESCFLLLHLNRLLVSCIDHIHFVRFQSLLQKRATFFAKRLFAFQVCIVQFTLQAPH